MMSIDRVNAKKTGDFFTEYLPDVMKYRNYDIYQVVSECLGKIEDVAGKRGGLERVLCWSTIKELSGNDDETTNRIFSDVVTSDTSIPGVDNKYNRYPLTTGVGSIIVVDSSGTPIFAEQRDNPEVDKVYGLPDPYVLEKLLFAWTSDIISRQVGDQGEGYDLLNELLASVGRVAVGSKVHIGMATHYEGSPGRAGPSGRRMAVAYAGASNFTLSRSARLVLGTNDGYYERKKHDKDKGILVNEADWLAGLVDSVIGYTTMSTLLGRTCNPKLPLSDDPKYKNVDIN